jgi:SAM-dependent methyltransferase
MANNPYYHHDYLHNEKDPAIIVPILYSILRPTSVLDVGCGIGNFLKAFKELGVDQVLGIDGPWVDRTILHKNIQPEEFLEQDLDKVIRTNKRFDLVLCLEVAEHLSPERAESLIGELVKAGRTIVFSAAIPGQGGTNHINEQWPEYWAGEFRKHRYQIHDVFKSILWDKEIHWWYKQNMLLALPDGHIPDQVSELEKNLLTHAIHPDFFADRIGKLTHILQGSASLGYYVKLIAKSILQILNAR